MIYYFQWEDMLEPGKVRRIKRVRVPDSNPEVVEFDWSQVAPTENLRIVILGDQDEHLGVIFIRR